MDVLLIRALIFGSTFGPLFCNSILWALQSPSAGVGVSLRVVGGVLDRFIVWTSRLGSRNSGMTPSKMSNSSNSQMPSLSVWADASCSHCSCYVRGSIDHRNIRILHSGSKAQHKGGVPETMACRILMAMLFFDPILTQPASNSCRTSPTKSLRQQPCCRLTCTASNGASQQVSQWILKQTVGNPAFLLAKPPRATTPFTACVCVCGWWVEEWPVIHIEESLRS